MSRLLADANDSDCRRVGEYIGDDQRRRDKEHAALKAELESLRLIESAPNKGVRVRNLTAADLEKYDRVVRENLTPACARWMATGEV